MRFYSDSGCVRAQGDVNTVVSTYLRSQSSSPKVVDLSSKTRPSDVGNAHPVRVSPSDANSNWSIPFGQQVSLDLAIDAEPSVTWIEVLIAIYSAGGFELGSWTTRCNDVKLPVRPGVNIFRIAFKNLRLRPGWYFLGIGVRDDRGCDKWIPDAVEFEITSSPEAAVISADINLGAFVLSAAISRVDQAVDRPELPE